MSMIRIRLDDEAEAALAELTRDGRTKADVIREAVLLAYRQRESARLRAEAEAAAADPADTAEIRTIREEMDRDSW